MSQYVTKLREERGRDGIEWPTPVGTWKQGENINRLETFANNLDVSQAPGDTDLLNSVPTPWARLLLFESALYQIQHPSHGDIQDQWRGLLGVLALAEPLRLDIKVSAIALGDLQQSRIAKTFSDLRPRYVVGDADVEAKKWNDFQVIRVDDVVLGATSPRTLVFTGVAHKCPASIPFQSPQGRLSDPVAYYKRFGDTQYLGLLAYWINGLITSLQHDQVVRNWLGYVPAAPGAAPTERMSSLINRLQAWQTELSGTPQLPVTGNQSSRFTVNPYGVVKGLPFVQGTGESSLYLRGRRDVIACYNSLRGSRLLNAFDQELINEPLRIYDGRWIQANQPLPLPFNFLPDSIRVIEDPLALFEDSLIQVSIPANPEAVYSLRVGDERNSRTYLFPFKPDILNYFRPDEIAENTKIIQNPQANSLRVELNISLENNRVIKASREYALDNSVIVNTITSELAAWPDFTSPAWNRYFYFKAKKAPREVDFEPLGQSKARDIGGHKWYVAEKPIQAFAGKIDDKSGLLLLHHREANAPSKAWKIGIDFGSTHTLAFSLRVEKRGDKYVTAHSEKIQPLCFATRARSLTLCEPKDLREPFFALVGDIDPPQRNELKTLLMLPEVNPGDKEDWLPREGHVYMHWILDGDYDKDRLRHNLKWNSHTDDYDLRAFLRCLLVMIQAEAASQEARIVSVSHSFPSAFTRALAAKHRAEWEDLEKFINLNIEDDNLKVYVDRSALTEAVAVCRHLECDQEASPVYNTICLDVGGSTCDMAIWAEKKLVIQESVKLASGVVNRYIQSPDAREFLVWLEGIVQKPPYNRKNFSMDKFSSKPAGFSLMFSSLLSYLDWKGNLDTLIDQVNANGEAHKLLAHIIFLFSGLLYYAGLLARKAGLRQKDQNRYFVYFCGKGGQFFKWVLGNDVLAQEMFQAGLLGPDGQDNNGAFTVEIHISKHPKQEVGRGLLAESALEGDPKGRALGIANPNPPSVTVGESGYPGLEWNAELSGEVLKKLPDNRVPATKDLRELDAFLNAFKRGQTTRVAAEVLKLDNISNQFQNRLLQRMFGAAKGCIVSDLRKNDPDALLEPLFITELKVLLETVTPGIDLFS